jgi:7-cyano-7-deazaguanine synthase in queuosine biosynthesis
LRRFYDETRAPFLPMWISPPKGRNRASETTTRGRSVLFFALGIAVADALNADRLVVPENGFISLNVPLSPSRRGSFSTRTTHPHFVSLVRNVLSAIGVNVAIELPYRFRTKGEMMQQVANADVLAAGVPVTMSCAHPSAGRWAKQPNIHCGRCVPCIIRRAGIQTAMNDPTPYNQIDLDVQLPGESGSDLTVVRMTLDRYAKKEPRLADILAAGPLPGTDAEKRDFLGVFTRGLDEIRALLG